MENRKPMKGFGYIYKYTSPSGKSYIGQTIRSLKERAGHNGKNYKGCELFYRAIKKYGLKSFEVEILEEVPINILDERERQNILTYNTIRPNGYNLTEGGKTGKRSETKKIYQYSSETGELIKEWPSTRDAAEEYNTSPQVLENCLQGYTFTSSNFCWSYELLEHYPIERRVVSPEKKKIYAYLPDGKLYKSYGSISEAALDTVSERSAIKRCCRGELKTHNGFIWKSDEVLETKKYNNKAKPVAQIDPNTDQIIEVFSSISSAARSLGKETTLIRRVVDSEKTAYGYKWKTTQGSTTTDP